MNALIEDIMLARYKKLKTWMQDTITISEAADLDTGEIATILLSLLAADTIRIAQAVKMPEDEFIEAMKDAWKNVPKCKEA